jgi:predicted dehydrogenase
MSESRGFTFERRGLKPLNFALVGAGVMGSNWARVIAESGYSVGAIIDNDLPKAKTLSDRYGAVCGKNIDMAANVDAVIIATSTSTHRDAALASIALGKPLLVEKPLATELDDVKEIVAAATEADLPLMCGFVERFNPAVLTLMNVIDTPVLNVLAVRHSPPDDRAKSGVAHDLLIHDIDLTLRAVGSDVERVVALTSKDAATNRAGSASCILQFSGGTTATLSASRAGHRKIRFLNITTEQCSYELDLLRSDITIYRHLGQSFETGGTYRSETAVDIPFIRHAGEPLALELNHFVNLLRGDGDPVAERDSILPPHRVVDAVVNAG